MYWTSFADFAAMGGYAGFIWPAFAAGLILLGGLALSSRHKLALAERDIAEARREAGRELGRDT
ncbi:heme exporter protein CcmD [Ferrovibrio sp.]|uniref:heme exporter protein CcmD n=1 Tax=Ferrovibrio sp. TaxID=1917215 RepID=UPI0025C6DAB2|nr:heme exporter protein CcmD [Ferrovibrio sp.]MBX3456001.1 heme exporter protein CcmD [Ferrovibrio sp.]